MKEFLVNVTVGQSLLALVALLAIFWTGGAIANTWRRHRGDYLGEHCEHCEQIEALQRLGDVLTKHVAELETAHARAVELRDDTDLTHPSVSETAMHTAALIVLGEDR